MKKFALFVLFAFMAAGLGGYLFVTNYGERGSGQVQTDVRELEPFERISVEEYGTLKVSTGPVQVLRITTDDNLLPLVRTEVRDGRLTIRPLRAINPSDQLLVEITVPRLSAVELAGAVSADLRNIESESLELELAGACGVDASGHVDKLSVELAGACRAGLKDLQAKQVQIEIAGMGSAAVYASESLDAEAAGWATIHCYGNPLDVRREAAGISRVRMVGRQEDATDS
jgi:hypothetical protein